MNQKDPVTVIVPGVRNARGRREMDTLQTTTGRAAMKENNLRYFKDGVEYIDIHEYAHRVTISIV